jgi:hypothetical protein
MIVARQAVYIELELDSTTNKYKFVGSCYRELTNTYKDDSAFFELMHDVIRCYPQRELHSRSRRGCSKSSIAIATWDPAGALSKLLKRCTCRNGTTWEDRTSATCLQDSECTQ